MEKVREELLCRYPFWQPLRGYRYSMDALLLAAFVRDERTGRSRDKKLKVLDIGTGSGIITLLLSKRFPEYEYQAVEIQEGLYEIAGENFALHGLNVELHHASYMDLEGQDRFDLIVSNPPFFKDSQVSKEESVAIARHELHASMETLVEKSKKLLKGGGFLYLIYPASRMGELMACLHQHKVQPYACKLVYPREGMEAEMVLVAAKKSHRGALRVLKPFLVYSQGEEYSPEADRMYKEGLIEW